MGVVACGLAVWGNGGGWGGHVLFEVNFRKMTQVILSWHTAGSFNEVEARVMGSLALCFHPGSWG